MLRSPASRPNLEDNHGSGGLQHCERSLKPVGQGLGEYLCAVLQVWCGVMRGAFLPCFSEAAEPSPGALNARMARFGRKFGPDPASESACTTGGIVANNSSGMACGTQDNAYRTLESVTVVLPSGTVVDTGTADADQRLRALEPELHEGLIRLARRVRGNPASVATIRHQCSMKNTMGYGVNSLLDFDRAVDILDHLIVGSVGTLGFVAEAVFRTIPRPTHTVTGLLVFPGLEAANAALPALVESGAATLELMDALSLRVGQGQDEVPPVVRDLRVRDHAALLVGYQAERAERLAELRRGGVGLGPRFGLSEPASFSADSAERNQLWHLRKGGFTPRRPERVPGHDGTARRRGRPRRGARTHLRRTHPTVRQARLSKQCDLRPRQGRLLPLHARRPVHRPKRAEALPRLHRGPGGPDPRWGAAR